ncbi:hypothetical protein FE257_011972 [Aspergillus nanangensis]|uniref:MOSC domain-containing protein n=1 Tax=Aspergillus nanangensis TaxID=2582783 RepID=A0AAD4CGZ1_ASPNN|nr:hypothetical protein FE257_011972 [Aspergillus nanangensis]
MKISQLYTYPIKSLRGVSISEAELTRSGFKYDRRFMLLKVKQADDGSTTLQNMHVPHFPEMALFLTDLVYPTNNDTKKAKHLDDSDCSGKIITTYRPPGVTENSDPRVKTLEIPLEPDVRGLKKLDITMHRSATKGLNMGNPYNDWFSECFGYPVVLAYLGPHSRRVLGNFPPAKSAAHRESTSSSRTAAPLVSTQSLVVLTGVTLGLNFLGAIGTDARGPDILTSMLPSLVATSVAILLSFLLGRDWTSKEEKITFADAAPYMLASEASVDNVTARLVGDKPMDVTKFRPNIVVSGAEEAFEEDFWAELTLHDDTRLLLTANCARCQSINVDYATGTMGKGDSGNVLKKLMKDRRVDKGMKYSPVFGRYVFLDRGSENARIQVGDEIAVSRRFGERTVFDWPGISNN